MVKVEGRIPEITFEVNGQPERVMFTGALVVEFWKLARGAFGWDKLPIKDIIERINNSQKDGAAPLECDEAKIIAAVDAIAPKGLKGQMRYQQCGKAFNEALSIVLDEMFTPIEDVKKK
ncbi:MAG TPA: hypothetical protein VM223_24415 [Planctomycetota bacterium]|nr:hypothetical protein [Planctomycetota bacterium]